MKKLYLLSILCLTIIFSSCTLEEEYKYYSEPNNYITATGTLTYRKYNENKDALYLGFDELSPDFSDNSFKIVGKNLIIVAEKNIDQKLEIGKQVEFISAPRYFGDGYVMPIVEITVDGETFLEFEQGYANWLEWINSNT